jgi:tRNA threonylcarbamoyladenosine biosynthesis protein TsaE
MLKVLTKSAEETRAFAAAIAHLLRPGDLLILSGDLGGGKTAFAQGLAAAMGIHEPVTSPTFVLAQTYEGSLRLHHLDLYRLDSAAEMMDLAIPELLEDQAVTAIEWGERFLEHLPAEYLQISFELGSLDLPPDVRIIRIDPVGPSWQSRTNELERATQWWRRR